MTNFDFLLSDQRFSSFASNAVSCEHLLHINADACVVSCRSAMEFGLRWIYSAEPSLKLPYDDTLYMMMSQAQFKKMIGEDIWQRMELIRKIGNAAAHGDTQTTVAEASLCIENLYVFLDYIAVRYGNRAQGIPFDASLLAFTADEALSFVPNGSELSRILSEYIKKDSEAVSLASSASASLSDSGYTARKIYVDAMLCDIGWKKSSDWLEDMRIPGIITEEGMGRADAALCSADGRILALIDLRHTLTGLSEGFSYSSRCAEAVLHAQGSRPLVFLTDGFSFYLSEDGILLRKIAALFSRRDLERRLPLKFSDAVLPEPDPKAAERYYHKEAAAALTDAFLKKKKRAALLAMADGTGKTRTVAALTKLFLSSGIAANVLFLSDEKNLVIQAQRMFSRLLPDIPSEELSETSHETKAQIVFSTYRDMVRLIDTLRDPMGKLLTAGHFDLVICDETHPAIFEQYRDLFTYFDAWLIGLSALPENEIDPDIYRFFGCEDLHPTYYYPREKAIEDGYLIDYLTVGLPLEAESTVRVYNDPDTDSGNPIDSDDPSDSAENTVFLEQALSLLLSEGLYSDHGNALGKTVIFSESRKQGERILSLLSETFGYPQEFSVLLDRNTPRLQDEIDRFSFPGGRTRIAVSVDVLDTGIDIPCVLNLVFLKKVTNLAKFRQMLGRGARPYTSPDGSETKEAFYVFDFCGNSGFFGLNHSKKKEDHASSAAVFSLYAQLICSMCRIPKYKTFADDLSDSLSSAVAALDRGNFAVRQHLPDVERFSDPTAYRKLTDADVSILSDEIAPLLPRIPGENLVLFESLVLRAELSFLLGQKNSDAQAKLRTYSEKLEMLPEIQKNAAARKQISKLKNKNYFLRADISVYESLRHTISPLLLNE